MASGVLRDFLDAIVDLFCNEKIFTVRGHAMCMLQWLETPHIFRSGGRVYSIGGPLKLHKRLLGSCISKMKVKTENIYIG